MHGEDHRDGGGQLARQGDHGALEDVGGGALDGHVHGGPLRRRPDLGVAAAQFGHEPAAAVQGADLAALPRLLDHAVEVTLDGGIAGEIGVDERLGEAGGDPDVAGEGERRLPVQERVVDDLGAAPQLVGVEPAVGAEDLEGGAVVDVVAADERLDEGRVLREVGEHPQLDLRVVGRDEGAAVAGHERPPDLAAEGGADGDVLQVRVAAAEPARRRHCLVERGVHPARVRPRELGQRLDVGALQLLDRPPVEHEPRQLVLQGELFQHLDRGRGGPRLAGLLAGRQGQLLEQDHRKLLRRVDVERLAGEVEDARLQLVEPRLHLTRLLGEGRRGHPHPGPLDAVEHRDQRVLKFAVQRQQPLALQRLGQGTGRLQGQVGPLAGVGEDRLGGDAVEVGGLRALAPHRLGRHHLVAGVFQGQRLHGGGGAGRVEQVAREHRVEVEAPEPDPVLGEPPHRPLQVVPDDADVRVLKDRPEGRERGTGVEGAREVEPAARERHVPRAPRAGREREPDDAPARGRTGHRQDVQPVPAGVAEGLRERPQPVAGGHRPVVGLDRPRRRRVLVQE